MIIRQERKEEYDPIYDLVKAAFQTANVSNGQEQDFANQLRSSNSYVPELALVAEKDNKLIGHIMLTKNSIKNEDLTWETLVLAPISVLLEYRNIGVGSLLINTSFKIAKNMGYESVILVGDPAYYGRFGFSPLINFGIRQSNGIPEEYVLACELVPGALKEIDGTIDLLSAINE